MATIESVPYVMVTIPTEESNVSEVTDSVLATLLSSVAFNILKFKLSALP